jgi:hypothetical protein
MLGAPWGSKGRSAVSALWLQSPMRHLLINKVIKKIFFRRKCFKYFAYTIFSFRYHLKAYLQSNPFLNPNETLGSVS